MIVAPAAPAPPARQPKPAPTPERGRFTDALHGARAEQDDPSEAKTGDARPDEAAAASADPSTPAAIAAPALPPTNALADAQALIVAMAGVPLPATNAVAPTSGAPTAAGTPRATTVGAKAAAIDASAIGPAVADQAPPGVTAAFQPALAAFAPATTSTPDASITPGTAPAPLAEAALTHHLDLAKDGAWLDRLARDIAQSADTSGTLRFSLAPERLGRLDVALAQGSDGTAIRLTTETREAHRIVADAQPRLVAEARAQGLTISETSVDLNGGGTSGGQSQAFGNQSARQEGQQRSTAWLPVVEPTASLTGATATDDELYA